MLRPCFLVVDREYSGSISTRKLVIETAKFNVITAYSGAEALETLEHFPHVDGVVLDVSISDVPCAALVQRLKQRQPKLTIIAVGRHACDGADYSVESFEPKTLLDLLKKLHPDQTAQIFEHEKALSDDR